MTNITSGSAVMTFEETIAYHLQYNIAVPLPKIFAEALAPLCVEAIKAVNDHNLEKKFNLPLGIKWVILQTGEECDYIPAYELVRIYGLTQWLNAEWF